MKKSVSSLSATMIGAHEEYSNPGREIFIQEAREITAYIKDIHHSRKISHQQVNYPETVQKLSNILSEKSFQSFSSGNQLNQPMARTETDFHKSMNLEARTMKLKEHQQKMIDHMKTERHINERKRLYNREIGRKAVVNQILSGSGPLTKSPIFPQKASHEQILAITGTLHAPNPFLIPPEVPRPKKWRGDGEGWSVN
eukprot:gene2152-2293_t